MCDLAAVADDVGIEYRLVGGQMVRLHVALADVPEPVVRVTQDADMGIEATSARDPALVPRARGARIHQSRRVQPIHPDNGRRPASCHRRARPSMGPTPRSEPAARRHRARRDSRPISGARSSRRADRPHRDNARWRRHVVSGRDSRDQLGPVFEALGWSSRLAAKDAVDVWRMLRAHRQRIPEPVEWRDSGVQGDAADILAPTSSDRQVAASAQRRRIVPNRPRSEPWRLPCCAPDAWLDQRESNSHRQHS
jgi:hypothetical protein